MTDPIVTCWIPSTGFEIVKKAIKDHQITPDIPNREKIDYEYSIAHLFLLLFFPFPSHHLFLICLQSYLFISPSSPASSGLSFLFLGGLGCQCRFIISIIISLSLESSILFVLDYSICGSQFPITKEWLLVFLFMIT